MTSASNDTPRPGTMTDDQLDQLLETASASLLGHITATADPGRTLTAIMSRVGQQEVPAETPVSVMIRLRDAAHDMASTLTLASASEDEISHAQLLANRLISALIPDRASDPIRVLERVYDLGPPRNLAGDLNRALTRAYAFITSSASEVTRARDDARTITRNLAAWVKQRDRPFELSRFLRARIDFVDLDLGDSVNVRDLTRVLDIIGILDLGLDRSPALNGCLDSIASGDSTSSFIFALEHNSDAAGDVAIYLERYFILGRDVASDIARAAAIVLAGAQDQARSIAQHLDSYELDASGEDLSGVEIRHLDALDGITWTRETTWPSAIAGDIEGNSYEIQPGVYQIRLGDTRGRCMLLTLA